MTPEEAAAYERGWAAGLQAAKVLSRPFDSDRVRAFGAIRRAVEIARDLDRDAIAISHDRECFQLIEQAEAIRDAIRAAIGSDKS